MKAIIHACTAALTLVLIIGFSGIPEATHFINSPNSSTNVQAFSRMHTLVGASTGLLTNERFTVDAAADGSEFGVGIALAGDKALNVHFEPVHINPGKTLFANLYDDNARKLVTVEHRQKSNNQTDLILNIENLLPELTSSEIEITTFDNGLANSVATIEASETLNLGTVTADDDDEWVKSWHIVCVDGECRLFVDPDNTEFEHSDSPGTQYPFEYISIGFKSNASFNSGTLELRGAGIGPISITNEDTLPLDLVNTLDS